MHIQSVSTQEDPVLLRGETTRGNRRSMTNSKSFHTLGSIAPAMLILGLLFSPSPAESQQVQGLVFDTQTGERVMGASVLLLDTTFTVVTGTSTNTTGVFLLESPRPGSFFVLTESLGYAPTMDGILDLGEGGSVTVEIYLDPKPIQLDSMKVAVERAETYLIMETAGFNERRQTGFGHFITPEEIQRRDPRYFFELFRNSPGVRVTGSSLSGTTIEFTVGSVRGPTCVPNVYVDGIMVTMDFGGLEAAVGIDQIAAVEIYTRASSVPLQWGGINAGCGTLLIWTR
jgi:hypothetical protein